jgi:hypothetical protein
MCSEEKIPVYGGNRTPDIQPVDRHFSTKMAVFWVVAPFSLVEVFQSFSGACCLHHQGDELLIGKLMMEAGRTSETLVNFYQTTRRYNPGHSHLRTHRRENLKSYRHFSD